MDLQEIRQEIDRVDSEMVRLYGKRMELTGEIGRYKREKGLPVLDTERERNLLNRVGEEAGEENENGVRAMFSMLMAQSRTRQMLEGRKISETGKKIRETLEKTDQLFPGKAMVACQGMEGAYSQMACEKLFTAPTIMYCKSFENVFSAIESGLCRYGILPIENSLAGSVNSVYDQMISHHFFIVRSTRVKIDHSLLTLPGVEEDRIQEVYSHEQAIQQCSRFLGAHREWRVNIVSNTAAAARMVAESGRTDIAAISSGSCAPLYGLEVKRTDIQNNSNNHTRFICISKEPEIYPGADRTSLSMILPHRPGSLYKVLSRFYALGINLNKLESRPLPDRNFEFMFYFDLDTPVYSPAFLQLMGELESISEDFTYLGSYSEVI